MQVFTIIGIVTVFCLATIGVMVIIALFVDHL